MDIIIDSDNYAEHGIETFFFPGGEPHARLPNFNTQDNILLFLKLRTWNDVGLAAAVLNAFWFSPHPTSKVKTFIPYFPGARQDRSDGFTPMTVDFMARLLDVRSHQAWSFDVHSDVSHNVGIAVSRTLMPADMSLPRREGVVGIIAPDEGAKRRAENFRLAFYPTADLITCQKKRNFETGKFEGFKMPVLSRAGRYIIVDDICDGGGTFNLLADAFYNQLVGAVSDLELFVSHGIFSKGVDALDKRIRHITTTDSWCTHPEFHRLTVLPLKQLFPKMLGALDA